MPGLPIPRFPFGLVPTAAFTFVVTGLNVAFTYTGEGAEITTWNFGDGTGRTANNPTHVYASGGSYAVTLTVVSAMGTVSTSQVVSTVTNVTPPSINSNPVVGQQLAYTAGVWNGASSVSAQAQRSLDGLTGWANVGAAWNAGSGTPYTVVAGDFAYYFRIVETATPGGVTATSNVRRADYQLLLYDTFTSGSVAPGTRTAEVGSWTIADTLGIFSLSGGKIQAATGGVNTTNPRITSNTFARPQGTVAVIKGKSASSNRDVLTFSVSAIEQFQFLVYDGTGAGVIPPQPVWSRTDDAFAFVFKATGADVYLKSGGVGTWRLIWRGLAGATTPISLEVFKAANAAVWSMSEAVVRAGMGGLWQTPDALLSVNQSAPASGASYAATADAMTDFAFTLPAAPSALDRVGFKFRVRDASNYWHAFCERNAGNTAWDFKLQSVAAGVATDRITPATGVGAVRRIRVAYNGSLLNCYTMDASSIPTARGGNVNFSHENSQTAIFAEYVAGTTSTALQSQPLTSATYSELDNVPLA